MNSAFVAAYSRFERTHWWFVVRRRIIAQTLSLHTPNAAGYKILNVGAAAGFSSEWLSRFGTVTSVENEAGFLEYLHKSGIGVVDASADVLPFTDASFDLVCAFDVLEHIRDDEKALQELFRVCKPGGFVCITVPAFAGLWSVHDEVNGHQRRYVRDTLRPKVVAAGFIDSYSTYFNTLLFLPIALVRKLQRLFRSTASESESDFSYYSAPPLLNKVLQKIFGLEIRWLKRHSFPFGVSLLLLAEKPAKTA
jgi:ubiquinone/menaquinone biosynthesis C-methylase UbiE